MDVRILASLDEVTAADWDRLAGDGCPFLRHTFLAGLEAHDCLEPQGWRPLHLLASDDGRPVGAMPLYLKDNSIGEFVFDWAWADAYERAGGRYYPKLVCAIPFTPVTAPRLLVDPAHADPHAVRATLVEAAMELAERLRLSSLHCLFPPQTELAALGGAGLLVRAGCQYHWFNRGDRDFEGFLAALNAKRRKQIRPERREVNEGDIDIEVRHGDAVDPALWRVFHEFYCSTFARRWGEPRLTLAFFESLSWRLPKQTVLLLARRRGCFIAGAFAMRGGDTLYGRHWGCSAEVRFLHFELCYYRTIEYCIEEGLARLDAGAQGEHKIARGFEPVRTWSAHWLRDAGLRAAVAEFLERERRMIDGYLAELRQHSPYRATGG